MYHLSNLVKTYEQGNGKVDVLNELNLDVTAGEFLCIMGSSGSGKSTLIKILSMIEDFDSGEVSFNKKSFGTFTAQEQDAYRKKNIGIIFQDYNLIEEMTIEENIHLGALASNTMNVIDYRNIVSMLHIENLLDKYPSQLSGGEQQRVAIARCLNRKADCIFADEPTGALNIKNTRALLDIFKDLNEKYKITIVMVTHDPFVASYSNRFIYLKDGKIVFEISKEKNREVYYQDILRCLEVYDG